LVQQNMVTGQRMHDHRRLRYYLDFCGTYRFAPTARRSLPAFQSLGFLPGMEGPPRESPFVPHPLKPCRLLPVGLSLLANKNNYMNLTTWNF
jgi:hypothetical protein